MGFDPGTIALIGAGATLASSFIRRPKSPKLPDVQQFRQPVQFQGFSMVDPSMRYISPFSTVQEQDIFRKQQEELSKLRSYTPKEKLGG